jgi:hypothetical protein
MKRFRIFTILTVLGLASFLFAGCQTPEERAMSQMEQQMRAQQELMVRMQKAMLEMEHKMAEMDKQAGGAAK